MDGQKVVGTPFNPQQHKVLPQHLWGGAVFFTGQIIEEARKKANITQAELAEKIGTNKSYISRIETGKTEPKVSTFYRIVSALGLTVELTPAM